MTPALPSSLPEFDTKARVVKDVPPPASEVLGGDALWDASGKPNLAKLRQHLISGLFTVYFYLLSLFVCGCSFSNVRGSLGR
mgnify:CR=1 FL=1